MASKTVDGLIAHCEKALKEKWKYVYGAKGSVLSAAQINALRRIYGSGCVWPSDTNKAGQTCCDCSGLISSYTGILRGSAQYKATSPAVYPISKRTKAMRGYAVWMSGHIGVYDGNDGYYAMDGSARNMVHYPLSKNSFTHIIKLADIDYGTGTTKTKTEKAVASGGAYNTVNSVSAVYAVKNAGNKNLPFVTNLNDYAGIKGKKVFGVAIKFNKNSKYWYRAHYNGKWGPKITGCDWGNKENGWAGDGKHAIDAIKIKMEGKKEAIYRVSPLKGNYYAYQHDVVKKGSSDGYAGVIGKPIDRLQIYAK